MEWFIAFFQISSVIAITAVSVMLACLVATTIVWSVLGYGVKLVREHVPLMVRRAAKHTEAPRRTVYNSLSHDIVRSHKLKPS